MKTEPKKTEPEPKTYGVTRPVALGHPQYVGIHDPGYPVKETLEVTAEQLTDAEKKTLGVK